MTSTKGIHDRITKGMGNLSTIFSDKSNLVRGLTKEETISLYFKIPMNKLIVMKKETIQSMWQEICTVKRYLRNTNQCAIDHLKASRGTVLVNEEFGRRQLDRTRNIFFKIIDTKIADGIGDRYDKLSNSIRKVGNKIRENARRSEREIPVLERLNQIQVRQ
jgi:hypothetical protein